MIKPTKHNLKKLEQLFEQLDYIVRYEKGNFQSGYCLVRDKKIAIVNKFYDTNGRIGCLVDILKTLNIEADSVTDPKMLKFLKQVLTVDADTESKD